MNSLLSWQAPEFIKYPKTKLWFGGFLLVATAFLALAFWWKSFTTIILVFLTILLVFIYSLKEPKIIKVKITPAGIQVDDQLYRFSEMKSFWIFYDPPYIKEISVNLNRTFFPLLSVPLGEADPNKVRKILLRFLPEKKQKESIADNIARALRF